MQFSDLYNTRSRKIVMTLMAIALCLGRICPPWAELSIEGRKKGG